MLRAAVYILTIVLSKISYRFYLAGRMGRQHLYELTNQYLLILWLPFLVEYLNRFQNHLMVLSFLNLSYEAQVIKVLHY